jgi:hypothetical protein
MAFNPLSTPVDFFILGGQKNPGYGVIQDAASPRKWDERQGYGLSGSFPIYLGRRLSNPVALIELCTDEDWAAWDAWKSIVDRPPNGKRPRALDIWHPWCAMHDIKSVGVTNVKGPDPIGETGLFGITIELIEYRTPKITLAKPEASAPDAPTDPVDKLIAKLTDQVQALAKG